jgi:hypothetical protein
MVLEEVDHLSLEESHGSLKLKNLSINYGVGHDKTMVSYCIDNNRYYVRVNAVL